EQKTLLAMAKGSGIMIWTLGFDTTDDTSLLTTIYKTAHP
ncbi:MAG: glycoside hydrolase, partial [Anaerolineales bacterium]|nr:glycoside hydrolase [Anaerolineales bacterium]